MGERSERQVRMSQFHSGVGFKVGVTLRSILPHESRRIHVLLDVSFVAEIHPHGKPGAAPGFNVDEVPKRKVCREGRRRGHVDRNGPREMVRSYVREALRAVGRGGEGRSS